MILIILLSIISIMMLVMALTVLSIGGAFFSFIAADLIVAVFIIWLLFFRKKSKESK